MEAAKKLGGRSDRISSLPDCLLHLIMAFLTAHEAVRTCVLSKRWKNLWTTLPYLDFDMHKFEDNIVLDESELEEDEAIFRRFTDFVNMTLLFREASDLHKFSLSCADMPGRFYNMFKRSWICYIIKHNPRVLDIFLSTIVDDSLPLDVFTCASLVNLSLSFGFGIPSSVQYRNNIVVVNLPNLKRLYLHGIFVNQDFAEKLFCGCPVLEFLHLQDCQIEFPSIRSKSLKHLILERYCHFEGTYKLELIDAPNLSSLNFSRCAEYIGHKMLLNMPSLMSASIWWGHGSDGQYNGKSNILTGISSVQSLKLYGSWIKDILENELPTCPEFRNAKDLTVDILCLYCHFNLLASFLDHFPNLKKLSLSHFGCYCKCQMEVDRNKESLKIAPFGCKGLETVDVRFSNHGTPDKNLHWVVKYLQEATEGIYAQINMTIGW